MTLTGVFDVSLDMVEIFSLGISFYVFTSKFFLCLLGGCVAVPETTHKLISWNFKIMHDLNVQSAKRGEHHRSKNCLRRLTPLVSKN